MLATCRTIIRCLNVIYVFDEPQSVNTRLIQESRVAQVMSHHDGGIQRTEVKGCNRRIVITFFWFDYSCTFVLFICACILAVRQSQLHST